MSNFEKSVVQKEQMTEVQKAEYLPFNLDLDDENNDCWATERSAIHALTEEVAAATSLHESLMAIDKSLRYFLTIEPYLRANPDCYRSISAAVYKLMMTPDASPLLFIILDTEKFLVDLRSSIQAELSVPAAEM